MTTPDFFLVGAPKCGTTAMSEYLRAHPEIFLSTPKEPLYFLSKDDPNRKIKKPEHYAALFSGADPSSMIGEASIWYLYSRHACEQIYEHNPGAKIIIMTRNAADFVSSLHSQLVFAGVETEKNVEKAWRRECERLIESRVDTIERTPNWRIMYAELLRHRKYISLYEQQFGPENVLVVAHEQMVADVGRVYRHILRFLGLRDDGRDAFPKVNSNKMHQYKTLEALLHFANDQRWAVALARKLKERTGISSLGIYDFVKKYNVREVSRPALSDSLRFEIESRERD